MRPGAASWRVITMCWVRLLPPQIRVATAAHSYGGALPERTGSSCILQQAASSDYAARTAQAIGLGFRTTRHYGHRPARYMKGPPQVHPGSMSGQRNRRGRPCEPALAQLPSWHGSAKSPPQRRQHSSAPSRAIPARGPCGPCVGQTAGSPIIFAGLGGTAGHRIQEERFGEPLLRPGFRPLYVRNHCYAGAHSGTS
jgi:hypothetical protein